MRPSRISSGGGVAVRAYDGRLSMVQRIGEVSATVSWALPGQIRSHAVWIIPRKPGEVGSDRFNRYPKKLLFKRHEANVASLMTKCLTRPVMWMVLESRPTSKSSSVARVSTASQGN